MSFSDLPEDWPTIPLTDPTHVANVLDIFVSMEARAVGSLLLLVCDELRRPVQAIEVAEISRSPLPDSVEILRPIASTIADALPDATLLCAIARTGSLQPRRSDAAWGDCLHEAFADRIPIIGIHVVTPRGTLDLGLGERAA